MEAGEGIVVGEGKGSADCGEEVMEPSPPFASIFTGCSRCETGEVVEIPPQDLHICASKKSALASLWRVPFALAQARAAAWAVSGLQQELGAGRWPGLRVGAASEQGRDGRVEQ